MKYKSPVTAPVNCECSFLQVYCNEVVGVPTQLRLNLDHLRRLHTALLRFGVRAFAEPREEIAQKV